MLPCRPLLDAALVTVDDQNATIMYFAELLNSLRFASVFSTLGPSQSGLQFSMRFLRCVDHDVVVEARAGLRVMRRGTRYPGHFG